MARTKQCARKTGGKAPQSGGAKAKGRYFDDAATEKDKAESAGNKANKPTSSTHHQVSADAHGQQRATESPPAWVEDRTGVSRLDSAPFVPLERTPAQHAASGQNQPALTAKQRRKAAFAERETNRQSQKDRKKARLATKKAARERRKERKKAKKEAEAHAQGSSTSTNASREVDVARGDGQAVGRPGRPRGASSGPRADQDPHQRRLTNPSNLEVDGILDVVEPVMRDIFRTQALAQCCNTSFAAAAPSSAFIPDQLSMMRSIVEMYQARGEEGLTRYQAYALESPRLGAGELEYMQRSDEEQGEAAGATQS